MGGRLRFASACLVAVCVAAGLAGPADAALPLKTIACGQTVKTSFRLNNDLANCTNHGIVVGKDGITIDLNSHTVDGTETGHGISNASGKDNVTIKNGTVQQFNEGVKIGDVSSGKIATGNKVKNIVATAHIEDGIDVDTGSGHKLIGNQTNSNLEGGIEADMRNSLVKGNTSNDNDIDGIDVDGKDNIVTGNTANDNADSGLETEGPRFAVTGNTTTGNGEHGTAVDGNTNVVDGNTSTGNDSQGLHLEGDRNKVKNNNFSTNGTQGIEISGDSNNVKSNQLNNNGENGLLIVGSAGNKISLNTANSNGLGVVDGVGLGIDAFVDTGVQGSGNSAAGNDDTDECIPLFLCT